MYPDLFGLHEIAAAFVEGLRSLFYLWLSIGGAFFVAPPIWRLIRGR